MTIKKDIAIIGAGLTGMTMAIALAKAGFNVVVIEAGDIKKIRAKKSDGRTCAIAEGSAEIFRDIGVWQDLEKNAGPILDIRITDSESPLFLHYDHKLVGDKPMGYIIENYHIREALFENAAKFDNLQIIDNASYESLQRQADCALIKLPKQTIKADLIIAADGKNSQIRQQVGIKTSAWQYKQSGIVCTVRHEKPHEGIAQERFLPAGPFAILPMHDSHLSSIVWTEKSHLAPLFMQMDAAEFMEHLAQRFGDYLGELSLASDRFVYPLSLSLAKRYTDDRLALIGDAAHAIHPIAGQGFNLGIRDVPVLTEVILGAKNNGFDIGNKNILAQYEKARKFDNVSLVAVTDALNRFFSNDIGSSKHLRRLGLAAVNKIPPLKKIFIRHAMGQSNFN